MLPSVGLLYAAQSLLELVGRQRVSPSDFRSGFRLYDHCPGDVVLELTLRCGWLTTGADGLCVSNRGELLMSRTGFAARLRVQLHDLLAAERPSWAGLLKRGRRALVSFADPDVVQCFRDAGLLSDSNVAAAWWDELVKPLWGEQKQEQVELGRRGEWLSMNHEQERTGVPPHWVALDDCGAGYDLLSQLSPQDPTPLMVEVKASNRPWDAACFFITRNEWNVLRKANQAELHLWCLAEDAPQFARVSIDEVSTHIPSDRGKGDWTETSIPYQALGHAVCQTPTQTGFSDRA